MPACTNANGQTPERAVTSPVSSNCEANDARYTASRREPERLARQPALRSR